MEKIYLEDKWEITLDTNWHLACLVANSDLLFYVDGNLIDSKSLPFTFNLSGYYQDVSLHRWWTSNKASRLNGEVDDLRIYNRALNATEVLSLYQNSNTAPTAGNSGTITTSNITSTSLTLNWTAATDGITVGNTKLLNLGCNTKLFALFPIISLRWIQRRLMEL